MIFDSYADFKTDLSAALEQSSKQNKKVIIEYGGDWCIWSERIYSVLEKPKFKKFIDDNFIFIRCYVGRDWESSFSETIEFLEIESVPYFSLLDSTGKFIANQETETYEILWFYNERKLFGLFKEWAKL